MRQDIQPFAIWNCNKRWLTSLKLLPLVPPLMLAEKTSAFCFDRRTTVTNVPFLNRVAPPFIDSPWQRLPEKRSFAGASLLQLFPDSHSNSSFQRSRIPNQSLASSLKSAVQKVKRKAQPPKLPEGHSSELGLLARTSVLWSSFSDNSNSSPAMTSSSDIFPPGADSFGKSWQWAAAVALLLGHFFGGYSLKLLGLAFKSFATWYSVMIVTHPMITKGLTTGVIGIIGDYMAQWIEYQRGTRRCHSNYNPKAPYILRLLSIHGSFYFRRGLAIAMDGVFISGPLMHLAYEVFESIVPVHSLPAGKSNLLPTISHVLGDSIFLDSLFVASTYLMTGIMEGIPPRKLMSQFKIDYFPALKASWATSFLLFPMEFLSFRFLPLNFRVLAVNVIDVFWDAVISFMAHRNRKDKDHVHWMNDTNGAESTSGQDQKSDPADAPEGVVNPPMAGSVQHPH